MKTSAQIARKVIEDYDKEYADYPYVDLSTNLLIVRFVATTFENV